MNEVRWRLGREYRMMYLDSIEPHVGCVNILAYCKKFGIIDVTARADLAGYAEWSRKYQFVLSGIFYKKLPLP